MHNNNYYNNINNKELNKIKFFFYENPTWPAQAGTDPLAWRIVKTAQPPSGVAPTPSSSPALAALIHALAVSSSPFPAPFCFHPS